MMRPGQALSGMTVALLVSIGITGTVARSSEVRAVAAEPAGAHLPRLLSETGLYADPGSLVVDPRNRPFSPQYPLWSDGALKMRWVYLPPGTTIDATDPDVWDFPVGTRFWKEFSFNGRRVETRLLWKATAEGWTFASYDWNDEQTDAVLAPPGGVHGVAEIDANRQHTIPSIADCRACHDVAGTRILGFNALQLSTDRDPNAVHAEPLIAGMVTLRTLVEEGILRPARSEFLSDPPRIRASDPRTRAVLGYLSTNCGGCHNASGSLAPLGLVLDHSSLADEARTEAIVRGLLRRSEKWLIPGVPEDASAFMTPGAPELSAVLHRMRSRRPSSQMPPLGTVMPDREAIDLVTAWIQSDLAGLKAPAPALAAATPGR